MSHIARPKILILGCGGPAGVNVAKSLSAFEVYGTDPNPFHCELMKPFVKKTYCVPKNTDARYLQLINEIIDEHHINFVHAQPDKEVEWLSCHRDEIHAKTFLPAKKTINICQDKYTCAEIWALKGFDAANAILIRKGIEIVDLVAAFQKLGNNLWIRASRGAGGNGSTPVQNFDTAYHWIQYWRSRGNQWDFIAQQNLTGRNLSWESLWKNGKLITSQGRERIEYIYPSLAPSGITGTPVVAKTVNEEELNEAAMKAVLAIDDHPNGIFSVDLKYAESGKLIPTEINAGRFFTTSYFYTKAGLNFAELLLQLAFDLPVEVAPINPLRKDLYWLRHIDCGELLYDLSNSD